jgi:hypothetical protein
MRKYYRLLALFGVFGIASGGSASGQDLGSFGVLAGASVTNTGSSTINGNVGVSPGGSISGFPPATVTAPYTIHNNDAVAGNAQSQLTTAYNVLAGRASTADLTGQDLGGQTLSAGVYSFGNSAQLTGTLTLDGQGDPNSIFIFNINSELVTASSSEVMLINGANANNVFFRVGSSATLGSATVFAGKILALSSISLNSTASINCGAVLARNGSVTLISNTIGICPLTSASIASGLSGSASLAGTRVGDAIDAYVAAGGVLPLGFSILGILSQEELDAALQQLAGETAPSSEYTTGQAMDSFLELLAGRSAPGDSWPIGGDVPGAGTVSVMGYVEATPDPVNGAFDAMDSARAAGDWRAWSGTYGSYSLAQGDAVAGTVDRSSAAYGLSFGFERVVNSESMFGLALSGGGTNFDLDDSLGSGRSAMVQAAVYGRLSSSQAYVTAAAAYGAHAYTTDRGFSFAGADRFSASFLTQDVAGQLEVGYALDWLTPYAGVRVQYIATPAYSEKTTAGASTFALDYAAHNLLTARTEIGLRAVSVVEMEASRLTLSSRAAWMHSFSVDRAVTASFQALPGSSFKVAGAEAAADAVLLSLGADLALRDGLALGLSVDSNLSRTAQSYSGAAHLAYSW